MIHFKSTGYSVFERDEKRLEDLKRSKEVTKKRLENQRRRREELRSDPRVCSCP